MNKKIAIIDDDADIRTLLSRFLQKNDFESISFKNGEEALIGLKKDKVSLALVDFRLPDMDGLELLQKLKIINPDIKVIIITAYSDVRVAVQAIKFGAYEYVTKPIFHEEILSKIDEALKEKPKASAKKKLTKGARSYIQGNSPAAENTAKHVALVAPTDMSVIIQGETGTGKEAIANQIHEKSKRKDGPFVAVDCGALAKDLAGSELFGHVKGAFTGAINNKKGHFEMADGGTLFLDEVGNLSYDNQIKLLRALQEQKVRPIGGGEDIAVDVRIIAASNEDLLDKVKEGEFREDLYHRLNEFKIEALPLRRKKEDIMLFANHFLRQAEKELDKETSGFSKEVEAIFQKYTWSGNLRELKNVIKRALLLTQSDKVSKECLPHEIIYHSDGIENSNGHATDKNDLKSAAEKAEYETIMKVLKECGNNKTKAAQLLNIDRKTLYNKLKAMDLH